MQTAVNVLLSVAVTAVAVVAVGWLSRRLRLIRLLAFPLYVAAVAAGLRVFLLLLGERPGELERVLSWTLLFLIAVLALRVLGLYLFDVYLHNLRGVRLPPLLPAVTVGTAYFIAALVTLRVIYPEIPLAPLLTTSAVTSLVLGLALQPILGNFFAGIVLSLEQPFRINDWIRYGDVEARVAKITWRTTHLWTRDNDTLVVPNAKIADQEILNFFYPHPLHMERIHVGVHYRTPPYRVKQALLDVVDRVESALKKPTPSVYLLSFDDSAITYELRFWIEDIANRPRIASHVRSEIWVEFARREITIPFPIRTLEFEPTARALEILRPPRREVEAEPAEAGPSPARLYVYRGPDRGQVFPLDGGGPATVGRSSSCSFTIGEPRASKEHFRVEWSGDGWTAADLGSQFGTTINGKPLGEGAPRRLDHLDHLAIGDTVIVFECEKR